MLLVSIMFFVAGTTPVHEISVSPEVEKIAAKYGDAFGPTAEAELDSLSKLGDRSASALLGELLRMPGRIGGSDAAGSCDYSEKAGQFSSALHNLATCYYLGDGRSKNRPKARELYRQAAELGFPKAKCAFGNMLVTGDGGPAEPERGIDLCRQAADTGLPDAQTDYAGYLLTGKYGPKDAVKARTYLLRAAEQGHANASFLLAQTYWYGDGVEKDVPKAAVWWITAYEKGRKDAPFWIGGAALGLIVDAAKAKQPVASVVIDQARKWLRIAAAEDPDPKRRESAKELQRSLEQLVGGT